MELLKLPPNMVYNKWDKIYPMIEAALPPSTDARLALEPAIVAAVVSGKLGVWAGVENQKVGGIITTCPVFDPISEVGDLLIYTMYAVPRLVTKSSMEAFTKTLLEYAKKHRLRRLVAYTSNEQALALGRNMGCDCSNTYMTLEVK